MVQVADTKFGTIKENVIEKMKWKICFKVVKRHVKTSNNTTSRFNELMKKRFIRKYDYGNMYIKGRMYWTRCWTQLLNTFSNYWRSRTWIARKLIEIWLNKVKWLTISSQKVTLVGQVSYLLARRMRPSRDTSTTQEYEYT